MRLCNLLVQSFSQSWLSQSSQSDGVQMRVSHWWGDADGCGGKAIVRRQVSRNEIDNLLSLWQHTVMSPETNTANLENNHSTLLLHQIASLALLIRKSATTAQDETTMPWAAARVLEFLDSRGPLFRPPNRPTAEHLPPEHASYHKSPQSAGPGRNVPKPGPPAVRPYSPHALRRGQAPGVADFVPG